MTEANEIDLHEDEAVDANAFIALIGEAIAVNVAATAAKRAKGEKT